MQSLDVEHSGEPTFPRWQVVVRSQEAMRLQLFRPSTQRKYREQEGLHLKFQRLLIKLLLPLLFPTTTTLLIIHLENHSRNPKSSALFVADQAIPYQSVSSFSPNQQRQRQPYVKKSRNQQERQAYIH